MARLKSIGSGNPDISVVDAAIVTLTKEIATVREEMKSQRSDNTNIIIGVLMALIIVVVAVAVQVMQANKLTGNEFDARFNFDQKLNSQQIEINDLENIVSGMRSNPLQQTSQNSQP